MQAIGNLPVSTDAQATVGVSLGDRPSNPNSVTRTYILGHICAASPHTNEQDVRVFERGFE